MPKKYCFACGAPNTYEGGVVPKFCSKCGKPLTLNNANTVPTIVPQLNHSNQTLEEIIEQRVQEALRKQKQSSAKIDSNDEDETEIFDGTVPRPSHKDCQINVPKFLTIADLQNRADPIVRENQQPPASFDKE